MLPLYPYNNTISVITIIAEKMTNYLLSLSFFVTTIVYVDTKNLFKKITKEMISPNRNIHWFNLFCILQSMRFHIQIQRLAVLPNISLINKSFPPELFVILNIKQKYTISNKSSTLTLSWVYLERGSTANDFLFQSSIKSKVVWPTSHIHIYLRLVWYTTCQYNNNCFPSKLTP